jgi:MYXO-CTERM domain-containing protein
MRSTYLIPLLLIGCGSDGSGNAKPDAGAAVDAQEVDAADVDVVTYPPATLGDDAVSAKKWSTASAPRLYMLAYTPIAVADARIQISGETCPAKTVNGDTTTYTGGCTDMDGKPWTGTAVAVGAPSGMVTYTDFGGTGESTCNATKYPSTFKYNGTITAVAAGTAELEITAEIIGPDETNNCVEHTGTFAIDYTLMQRRGTHDADGDGDFDDTYWSGSGRYGDSIDGAVDAVTTEEKLEDEICNDEALAGDTVVTASGHAIKITYDGATDCDPESTVHWAYDGTDRGEISDVSCSAGGSPGSALVLVVAVGAVVRRRRRR